MKPNLSCNIKREILNKKGDLSSAYLRFLIAMTATVVNTASMRRIVSDGNSGIMWITLSPTVSMVIVSISQSSTNVTSPYGVEKLSVKYWHTGGSSFSSNSTHIRLP